MELDDIEKLKEIMKVRIITTFGTGSHIIMPKSDVGKRALIIVEDSDDDS